MALCEICRAFHLDLLLDEDDLTFDLVLHNSLPHVRQSASRCSLCHLLWTALVGGIKTDGRRVDPNTESWADRESWTDPDSPVVLRGRQTDTEPCDLYGLKVRCDRFEVHNYLSFSSPCPEPQSDGRVTSGRFVLGRQIKPAEQRLDLLGEWTRNCDENHSRCKRPQNYQLPTRAIDVGGGGNEPRLAETAGQTGRYMTLSHCWGGHSVIQTTTKTYQAHLAALPLDQLPKTFRDAVIATRALGIQYLWIDSLCIIQDSTEDWEIESARMGDIYYHSYLTIAASASQDSRGGLFVPRSASDYVAVNIDRDGHSQALISRQPGNFDDLGQRKLFTRAWVLQEKVLSNRMISFDTDQLLWECQEERLAEDGFPYLYRDTDDFASGPSNFLNLNPPYVTQHYQGLGRDFRGDWYEMVDAYSYRGITVPSDKLPALSGIAKYMGDRTGAEYIAGLWRSQLCFGLTWRRSGPWMRPPSDGYRAPSWSWAALDGHVFVLGMTRAYDDAWEEALEDISVSVTPRGKDPRGAIASGSLTVTGRLRVFDRRKDPADSDFAMVTSLQESMKIKGAYDDYLLDAGVAVGEATFDEAFKDSPHELYGLEVCRTPGGSRRWYALLLEPSGSGRENEFRRIGFCHSSFLADAGHVFADAQTVRITIV